MIQGNFLQWKGTDVCIDLHCVCGRSSHYDGDFLYAWKCRCGRVWIMGTKVEMHERTDDDYPHRPVTPRFDEADDGRVIT